MAEIQSVVPKQKISYKGIFSIKELRDIIMDWIFSKAYVPIEGKVQQVVKKDAKFFEYKFAPDKKLSDYAKAVVKIVVSASDCKDVLAVIAGKKRKMLDGKVIVAVEGLLHTDYESKWEKSGWLYALRIIFEKYVLSPFISHHAKYIENDTNQLVAQIRSYFNLQKKMR